MNTKKGPAVQALRAQADKITYPQEMLKTLQATENLEIKEAMVEKLLVENNKVVGVELANGEKIQAEAVILTTGTYLRSVILVGDNKTPGGPHGEKESKHLSTHLKELGFTDEQIYTTFELRMKCGIGKCGRCNIGSKYVCKDGPVFRYDEIGELPPEY